MRKIIKNNYEKFVGCLTKKGNKVAAQRILKLALLKISAKKKVPSYSLLPKIFKKLENFVEVKKVTWGQGKKQRINLIPFPLKPKRQNFLKMKWIIDAAKEDKRKLPFSEKLATEVWNLLYDKKKSKAIAKKKEVRQLVLDNRSNSHFRW